MKIASLYVCIILFFFNQLTLAQNQQEELHLPQIARLKYRGGGDWYNDPSSLINLVSFSKKYIPIQLQEKFYDIDIGHPDLYQFPIAFMTGHGTLVYHEEELKNIRQYLENGGFLYIDDDYGFDATIRSFINALYANKKLIEVPHDHLIYHNVFKFLHGLPKVHEHDNKPPQGLGLFIEGKLVLFYSYESNLADGWADPEVHNNPPSIREEALKMGVNILTYALTQL